MKSEWSIKPLSECIELIIDYRGKTPKKLGGDWSKTGYRALSAKNVKTSGLVQEDIIRRIDDDIYKKWMKEEVKRGDILLTSEAPLGEVLLWDSDEKIVLSQRLFAIRPNKNLDSAYMFYYMSAKKYQHELESHSTGTTVVGIKQTQLVHTVIEYPKLDTQKRIAHILSTLDDKIELNRKMNQTLEEMAQALFKSWFVDFDPVYVKAGCTSDAELEQAAVALGISKEVLELFPSAFVESEMGMIPDGWELKELGELTNTTSSKRIFSREYIEEGIPFYRSKEIINLANGKAITEILYISQDRYSEIKDKFSVPKAQDILITSVGTIGRIYLVPDDSPFYFKDGNLTWINDYKNTTPIFVYNFLKSTNTQKQIDSVLIGSTQKALTIVNINKLKVVQPSSIVLEEFTKQAQSIFDKVTINTNQMRVLEKTRDTLLPKLLSGELDVSEIEEGIE